MLPKALINKLLGLSSLPVALRDDDYALTLLSDSRAADYWQLVELLSAQIQDHFDRHVALLGLEEEILRLYRETRILALPSRAFSIEALQSGGTNYVVISHGFLAAVSARAEFFALHEKVERSALPESVKDRLRPILVSADTNGFYSFMLSGRRLLSYKRHFSLQDFQVYTGSLYQMECFALLHELAHFQLGHCELPGAGESPLSHVEAEIAADRAAILAAPEAERRDVVGGAIRFLIAIIPFEHFVKKSVSTHPSSLQRLRVLVDTFQELLEAELVPQLQHLIQTLEEDRDYMAGLSDELRYGYLRDLEAEERIDMEEAIVFEMAEALNELSSDTELVIPFRRFPWQPFPGQEPERT